MVAIYDNSGTPLVQYVYDAWGNQKVTYVNGGENTAAQYNPFRYRGYYYDADFGFYYLNSRYYDSNTCRFISPDGYEVISATPMALTDKNLYAYCDNNPIMRVDNGGEFWNVLIGAGAGAAVGALISASFQLSQDVYSWRTEEFWSHIGVAATVGLISGGLASSGVPIAGQVLGNAILSAAGSIADTAIDGETSSEMYIVRGIEGATIGALSGAIGGKGSASKHLTNSFYRVLKSGNWSYYFSQINTQAFRDGLKQYPAFLKQQFPLSPKTQFSRLFNRRLSEWIYMYME